MPVNTMNFLDPQFLMGVIEERQDFGNERSKYIGERFFPRQNYPEQTVLWELVRQENRLAGVFSAKGKAVPGDDIGWKTMFANVVWIKAAKYLDPDIVQKVRDPGMLPVYKAGGSAFAIQGIAQRVESKMREYLTFVDDQIAAQEEYFALQAMQGALRWPPLGADGLPIATAMPEWNADEKVDVTWPFTTEFKQSMYTLEGVPAKPGLANRNGTKLGWTDPNADPAFDLEVIADMMMELKNVDMDGATALMSRKAISYISHLENVQRWLRGTNYVKGDNFINNNLLKERVKSTFGLNIETYDAKWTYLDGLNADGSENISSVRFLPAHKMVIVPKTEKIGVMAQSPHETQDGNYVHGKTLHIHRAEKEPHERELSMSNLVFPLLTQPAGIGVFDLF